MSRVPPQPPGQQGGREPRPATPQGLLSAFGEASGPARSPQLSSGLGWARCHLWQLPCPWQDLAAQTEDGGELPTHGLSNAGRSLPTEAPPRKTGLHAHPGKAGLSPRLPSYSLTAGARQGRGRSPAHSTPNVHRRSGVTGRKGGCRGGQRSREERRRKGRRCWALLLLQNRGQLLPPPLQGQGGPHLGV